MFCPFSPIFVHLFPPYLYLFFFLSYVVHFCIFCIILSFEHDCELYLDDQTQDEKEAERWLHVDTVVHGVYCLHLDLIGSQL